MALRVFAFVWITALALGIVPALAQQTGTPAMPPQEPILRIDPGMHTAPIWRIGVDAACTLLATASDDKTLRLWGLKDGKLHRTFRAPIGPGNSGKLRAVAIAPDSSWLAGGGWDGSVYIFSSATGVLTARLGPLGAKVNHLVVSPDGRYLAATLGDGKGLRVWQRAAANEASWLLVAEDRDYGGKSSHDATFDHTGVLFTVADDGKVRRYAQGYKAKPTSVAIRTPLSSVAVHPLGDRLAVGHRKEVVEIYDAATLIRRFTAKGVRHSSFGSVAWSRDGARLYGAMTQITHGLRIWDGAGEGLARDVEGPRDLITHLLPCGDDIAFGSAYPAFGFFLPHGGHKQWQLGVQADLRGRQLSVAADGTRVRFGLEAAEMNPVLFDLMAEQLRDAIGGDGDLAYEDTISASDFDQIRRRDAKYFKSVVIHSRASAPDKQHFVIGTDLSLRGYDKDGKQLWIKEVPDVAWGVNIPREGRLVLAAYGDGTIRWHRLTDGQELLALFVHKIDRRWVAWTPKGYYMASPGGESLIGWHVNRGWEQAAQFFAVDRFRDQFNRPDIVKLVLAALDEGKAIEEANRRAKVKRAVEDVREIAPPSVVIQKPGDGSTFRVPEVTIEYDILSHTGQSITNVDVRVNNAALGARSVIPVSAGKYTPGRWMLTLPPEDVTITVVAYEGNRASEPASIRLRWDGAKPGQVALPRLRALFVGINSYTSPRLAKLSYAAKDATDLAAFFASQEGKTYSKVEPRVLPDAKRTEVIKGLEWLEKDSEADDVNLLFLAGHGATIEQHFYYMAADSDPGEARATAVSKDEILRTIGKRKGRMVVMLDACHSGASADGMQPATSRVDMNRLANELGDKSLGVMLYASARGRQLSYEHPDWRNGAFTRAMIEGLEGAADRDKRGFVDTEELSLYVRRRVLDMTKDRQEPVRVKPDAEPEMRIVLLK